MFSVLIGVVAAVSFLVVLAVVGPRRWSGRVGIRRPVRSRQVRERLPGRSETAGERRGNPVPRVPADVPVARSRAIELANRRSIRWKDQ